jgi:hypothetical protein
MGPLAGDGVTAKVAALAGRRAFRGGLISPRQAGQKRTSGRRESPSWAKSSRVDIYPIRLGCKNHHFRLGSDFHDAGERCTAGVVDREGREGEHRRTEA